jgi:hypothetical protein
MRVTHTYTLQYTSTPHSRIVSTRLRCVDVGIDLAHALLSLPTDMSRSECDVVTNRGGDVDDAELAGDVAAGVVAVSSLSKLCRDAPSPRMDAERDNDDRFACLLEDSGRVGDVVLVVDTDVDAEGVDDCGVGGDDVDVSNAFVVAVVFVVTLVVVSTTGTDAVDVSVTLSACSGAGGGVAAAFEPRLCASSRYRQQHQQRNNSITHNISSHLAFKAPFARFNADLAARTSNSSAHSSSCDTALGARSAIARTLALSRLSSALHCEVRCTRYHRTMAGVTAALTAGVAAAGDVDAGDVVVVVDDDSDDEDDVVVAATSASSNEITRASGLGDDDTDPGGVLAPAAIVATSFGLGCRVNDAKRFAMNDLPFLLLGRFVDASFESAAPVLLSTAVVVEVAPLTTLLLA